MVVYGDLLPSVLADSQFHSLSMFGNIDAGCCVVNFSNLYIHTYLFFYICIYLYTYRYLKIQLHLASVFLPRHNIHNIDRVDQICGPRLPWAAINRMGTGCCVTGFSLQCCRVQRLDRPTQVYQDLLNMELLYKTWILYIRHGEHEVEGIPIYIYIYIHI